MSNQRVGNRKPATLRDNNTTDMQLRAFFRTAAAVVDPESDAQFYFEQLVDYIPEGGSLSTNDPVAVRRILGV